MFEDLVETCQELQQMLTDVQENYGDFHPDDVIEMLRNCLVKSAELHRDIGAKRAYIRLSILPGWEVTQRGDDAGMPPAGQPPPTKPPVTGEGKELL